MISGLLVACIPLAVVTIGAVAGIVRSAKRVKAMKRELGLLRANA